MTEPGSTVSDVVARVVAAHAATAFGVMGNGNAFFVNGLLGNGTRYVQTRHEAGAVAAADAYYRASGGLAVATTTYGPGFTNALTPLTEAAQARIPLLYVAGAAPDAPRPWDVHQFAVSAGLGVPVIVVENAEDAVRRTVQAIRRALDERRPVYLALPSDISESPASAASVETELPPPTGLPGPDTADVETVAALLRAAERPLILGGRGVWLSGSGSRYAEIADRVGALLATTAGARATFGESPWDIGISGGFAPEETAALIGEADVVLAVGAGLNPFTMRFGHALEPEATLVHVDLDDSSRAPRVNRFVRADAAVFADALLGSLGTDARSGWRANVAERVQRAHLRDTDASELTDDGRLDPRPVARDLDLLLPAGRTIVLDGGHFVGWPAEYWRADDPSGFLMVGSAYQTIGLGLPAAVGAAVARPDRLTVLATGDGGLQMAIADLPVFIEQCTSGVIVVFNDGAYGAELHQYGPRGLDIRPAQLGDVSFAAVAVAYGARAATIRSLQDLEVLRTWVGEGAQGVLLLDCRVSPSVVAPFFEEIRSLPH